MLGELVINVMASVILLGFGFVFGKYRERRARAGRNLEDYDFYPFSLDEKSTLYFDMDMFTNGVRHLLARRFKSTTIPIYRERCGLVGAVCINVDMNYLRDED